MTTSYIGSSNLLSKPSSLFVNGNIYNHWTFSYDTYIIYALILGIITYLIYQKIKENS